MALIRAILTDIEGTTSALTMLKQVLAPYARAHLAAFVAAQRAQPEVREALAATRALAQEPGADEARTLEILVRWIDEDRKAPPLKTLQGLVWERGFHDGSLRAHLYPDVVPALSALKAAGLELYVYSSGSVHAQRLFFEYSIEGNVRGLFDGFFDTGSGPKLESASYRGIARALGLDPAAVLFLSDAQAELDAAEAAGLCVLGLMREGNPAITRHRSVASFAQIAQQGLPLRSLVEPSPAAHALAAFVRQCHARGWADATSGNFSVRVGPDRLAITASGRDKSTLTEHDVVMVDLAGRVLSSGALPSAETPLHCALYRARPALGAVAHTHSRAATVLSRAKSEAGVLRLSGYEMQKALAGVSSHTHELCLPVVPNSQDMTVLGSALDAALTAYPAAPGYLVAGHGLTTWAVDLTALKRQLEALEFLLDCELLRLRSGSV
jgi:2,3-diketo-5-methylthio-1-phosphopentane phosphatase/methylthioribulose-1-phosphate dehydratase